jgi:formylglycine-generating enzyme required for sulfatase activity
LVVVLGALWWTMGRGDGAPVVLVPAGSFTMGDDEESPKHDVYVDRFELDRNEVTIAQYSKFLTQSRSAQAPEGWEGVDPVKDGSLPVVGVDWNDAAAYCAWAGKRLPTEAEWEKAARGTDGRLYPWGDSPPTPERANYASRAADAYHGGLAGVGTHPTGRSLEGADDLAGNATEWVADWYGDAFSTSDVRNPKGPASGPGKVIRGGGFRDPAERVTATKRFYVSADARRDDIGFRCARDR